MKKPSVVQVIATAAGGVVTHVDQVLTLLSEAGYRVGAVHSPSVRLPHWQGPTETVFFSSRPSIKQWRARKALARALSGYQVVHAHGIRAGALAALALGNKSTAPLVVTLHNLPVGGPLKHALTKALLRIIVRRASVVLAVSPDLLQLARSLGAAAVQLAKVPHNLHIPANLPARNYPPVFTAQRPLRLITVARAEQQKGLDLLIQTARLLQKPFPQQFSWQVVGDGPQLSRLRQAAADLGEVSFCGWRQDVEALLESADVFVSTSRWEGQPVAVQEALAHGLPVVATEVGGTANVLGNSGLLVPYEAPSLGRALESLIENPGRLSHLSVKSYQRAQELPTSEQLLAQLDMIYSAYAR